ncbi:hypothetical protein BH20ACT6_BH20ACT6_10800 [soil metagenome]
MGTDHRGGDGSSGELARRLGALAWLVQPAYIAFELAVSARARGYSLAGDTISGLGATACGTSSCSPWHPALNASFVLTGLLFAAGALLLRPSLPAGRLVDLAVLLWVLAGLSSVATGLVPVNEDAELHYAVAAPLFLVQPVSLLLLGWALWARARALASFTLLTAVGCAVATWLFLALPAPGLDGLLERLALWPVKVVLGVLAIRMLTGLAPTAAAHRQRARSR